METLLEGAGRILQAALKRSREVFTPNKKAHIQREKGNDRSIGF